MTPPPAVHLPVYVAVLVGYYSSIVAARAASFELRDARKAARA